jgi:hypothetical protein
MLTKTNQWIDRFQRIISYPVASQIAQFAKVPLIGAADLTRITQPKTNILSVTLGPFQVAHNQNYSIWQPFWISVCEAKAPFGNIIAAALCLLDNRGSGGFRQVRLWDREKGDFRYHGDPNHERNLPWQSVYRLITEYLAAEYHVGFVEEDKQAAQREALNNIAAMSKDEIDRQIAYEKEALHHVR